MKDKDKTYDDIEFEYSYPYTFKKKNKEYLKSRNYRDNKYGVIKTKLFNFTEKTNDDN